MLPILERRVQLNKFDMINELALLYIKIIGVAMSGYFLMSANNPIEILIGSVLILGFAFTKTDRKDNEQCQN